MPVLGPALQRLIRAGSRLEPEAREQHRVAVNNALALGLAFSNLAYVAILFALGLRWHALLLLPLGSAYLLPVWLNHRGRFALARFVLITAPNVLVLAYTVALGLRGEISLFYATACGPVVVCSPRQWRLIAWGTVLSFLSASALTLFPDAILGPALLPAKAGFLLKVALELGTFVILLGMVLATAASNGRAKGRLLAAHLGLRRLLDRVDQGFATLDVRGCVRGERSAVFDMCFGSPADGTAFADCLTRLDPAVAAGFREVWQQFADGLVPADLLCFQLPSSIAVSERSYRLDYKPDLDDQGLLTGLMVVMSDVTAEAERERAEARQRELQAGLAQSQKLESVGRLASGVAHEINTPVQFVGDSIHFVSGAFAELQVLFERVEEVRRALASGTATPADAERLARATDEADLPYLLEHVPKALARMTDGVGRVANIVRSMKEFAHPDGAEKVAADLNRALLSTVTVATNSFKLVADLETRLGDIPKLSCHLGSLNQVFLNLIVNAGDAVAEVVSGTHRRGRITVETRRDGESILISVADDGAGIPAEVQSRIFDQFFTTKEVGKGTGQGLALARRIVASHGGSIWFESEPGKGTTFFVRLPLADPAQSQAA